MHLSTIFVVSAIATSAVCALPLQAVDPSTSSDVLGDHIASDGSGGQLRVESSLRPRAPCLISCTGKRKPDAPRSNLDNQQSAHGGGNPQFAEGGSNQQPAQGESGQQPAQDGSQSGQSAVGFGPPRRAKTELPIDQNRVPWADISQTNRPS
ncbi:hypothetical protein F5878DRAFT_403454 [Lentinula raphanica]|uniref:Uncharacterized protein n=1 Tax=Lentinula raphanica TaxID=153919 RepID=A0AA38U720_9AGAR|nr:hypothetical protein F5878DRAFT_403454 [Lentinula raphanica]